MLGLGRAARIPLRNLPVQPVLNRHSAYKRLYSGSGSQSKRRGSRRFLLALGATTAVSFVLYETNDSVKNSADFLGHAFQRVTSVTSALGRCIWHYYWFLNTEFPSKEARLEKLSEVNLRCAKITRRAIELNGGLYIKLGQHISALTYIFPEEWTETMIPLQDQCPVTSFENVQKLFIEDEGKPIEEIFSEFSPTPLGTASLAQVHKARLKGGDEVAVKVQHPSLQQFIPLDIALVRTVFESLDYFFPEYPLTWLSDEVQNSVYHELDFREEAKNAMHTSEYFAPYYKEAALRVPLVYWAKRRLLCMEFLSGGRPDDKKFLVDHHIDQADLSACFSHIFNNMIFTPLVGLHCDPHAGNIAIRPLSKEEQKKSGAIRNFEVILYDHGLYRYVPTKVRRAYSHLWLCLLDGDTEGTRKYAKEFASVSDDDFNLFAAAITGRAFDRATSDVVSRRDKSEREHMAQVIQEKNLIGDIIRLLNTMPPVVLLILKTNDLTRYLDEKLDSPLGVERSFLIMARYCARTVYDEGLEQIKIKYGKKYTAGRLWSTFTNWWSYFRITSRLTIYDFVMWLRPKMKRTLEE